MKDYIQFRVYIRNNDNPDLTLKIANELQDVIHDYIGDSVIQYGHTGGFTDVADVLHSGDVSYELHLADEN